MIRDENCERNIVELRIKIEGHEVEITGGKGEVIELLDRIAEYVSRYSEGRGSLEEVAVENETREVPRGRVEQVVPVIHVTSKDTVASILQKMFSTPWASKPRTLRETLEALSSIGLHYPKSTVAVSLSRLVRRNVIRRMKSKRNIYVYIPLVPSKEKGKSSSIGGTYGDR